MRYAIAPLLAGLLITVSLSGSANAQILHLDKSNIDFGTMNQHESRDTQVTITNKGGGMLIISEVKADCGCTVPTLAKMQLAPGESTIMDINFNSKAFNGHVTKLVHLFSNDPNSPDTTFFITASVFSTLLIEPVSQRLGFSRHPVGTSVTKMAFFTATEAPELIIKAKKSRKNLFEVSVINNYEGDPQRSALVITVPEEMKSGRQRDNVRVKTNIEGHETVDIQLSAWPIMALNANMDKINFRYKKSFKKSVHVQSNVEGLKFKVTSVECDLPEIHCEFEERIPNEQTILTLSGAPIDKNDPRAVKKKGRITGTIIIHTDLDDQPTIEIPVSYMIRMGNRTGK